MRTILAAAILVVATIGPACADAPPSPFVGEWSGVRRAQAAHYAGVTGVKYEIRQGAEGLEVVDLSREAIGLPPARAVVDGRTLHASWPAMMGRIDLTGELSRDGRSLTVAIRGESDARIEAAPLVLTHHDPAAERFFRPRDPGAPASAALAPPPRLDDGWAVGSLEGGGVNGRLLQQMVEAIGRQTRDPTGDQTDSVLIARDGKLVFESYFWGWDRQTPHEISSDTKSVTSILTGVAVDAGALKETDLVWTAFPDYSASKWVVGRYPTTLADMLSMTANLDWNEDLPYLDPRNTAAGLAVATDPVGYVLDRGLAGPPGAKFQYNSGLPNLVGDMVSRRVGVPFDQFAERRLFAPLGVRDWYWTRQKNGHVLAAGGLYLRPRDMAKIGQTMLDGGVWDGRRIVSARWVERSTAQHTPSGDYAYGYYWHLSTPAKPRLDGEDGFMAIGQAGQYIVVIPRLRAVIVVTSSNWQAGGSKLALSEIIDRFVVPALQGRDAPV